MVKKAVILAGGNGTRMLPFTKAVPKELLPIGSVPCIQLLIEECYFAGIKEFYIVINKNKSSLISFFDKNNKSKIYNEKYLLWEKILKEIKVEFIIQGEKLGTAGALSVVEKYITDEPFFVLFPDEVTLSTENSVIEQMLSVYSIKKRTLIAIKSIPKKECYKYGVLDLHKIQNKIFSLNKIIEKPSINTKLPSNYISTGRFIFHQNIFSEIKNILQKGNEYLITDAINNLAITSDILCYEYDGIRCDLGNEDDYMLTNIIFSMQKPTLKRRIKDLITDKI